MSLHITDKDVQKRIKQLGYKGCKNCQHQIAPLRMCKWVYKKETRRYCGDDYLFGLEVEQPYCPKCGEPVYDKKMEAEIRTKAHSIINKCKGAEG